MAAEFRSSAERLGIPLAIVGLMSFVAAAGFLEAFSSSIVIAAAFVGAASSVAVAFVADVRRLLLGESVALSLGSLVVVGIVFTLSPTAFFEGLIGGWADLLSGTVPADPTPSLRVVPFTTAWMAGLVGGEVARSVRIAALPAVGPFAGLIVCLLFTVENRTIAVGQGALLAVGTLALGWAQGLSFERERRAPESDGQPTASNRFAMALFLGVVILAGAPLVGPRLPLAESNERFDLREFQEPPFDPLAIPSPLVQLKANLREDRRTDVVFTIAGDQPVTRIPVAVHGAFDGVVWTVAEGDAPGAGEYLAVGSQFPTAASASEPVEHRIEIGTLRGHFLPRSGYPTSIAVDGESDLRFNEATGNVAAPNGVAGMVYTIRSRPLPELSLGELRNTTFLDEDRETELGALPPVIRSLAADIVEGRDFGWPQVEAISDAFQLGFYDATETSRPGHSYFRLGEFLDDPKRIVGHEEQYGAAAAVLARISGIPSRVVVGYELDSDAWANGRATVRAGDISAWLEVRTKEWGWIPVDVTPDRTREPNDESVGVENKNVAVPNPPPPPPPQPERRPPIESEEDDSVEPENPDEVDDGGSSLGVGTILVGAAITSPAWGTTAVVGSVIGLKHARSRRRRASASPSARISGAWHELLDRYREAGLRAPGTATPSELVAAFIDEEPAAAEARDELLNLANAVDEVSFSAQQLSASAALEAWENMESVVDALYSARSPVGRIRMKADPRPLFGENKEPV